MSSPSTYSFKDTSGSFTHAVAGLYTFGGQIGLHQATVIMATEKTVHDTAADGTIMISAIAGDSGNVSLEMQQTSSLHAFLLSWYNLVKTSFLAGDVSNWATAIVTLRNLVDGSYHLATGVSPSKPPDKPYTAQGQHITWVLMCADIQSLTL